MTQAPLPPLQPGDPAPDFVLPSIKSGTVSLADYRERTPVLLGLFRGLYCPFCRRSIAQMAASAQKLASLGIESLGVVATELENARLYFQYRPVPLPLVVDPNLSIHRSYRVPRVELTPELLQSLETVRINPTGELPEPKGIPAAAEALNVLDRFQPTPVDEREGSAPFAQFKGQFLIDRDGIIRWVNVECQREGPAGFGKFPTTQDLISAAQVAAIV